MNNNKKSRKQSTTRASSATSALLLGLFILVPASWAAEANLTRFGPMNYQLEQGKPTTYSANFRAMQGRAKLVLQDQDIENAWIEVNGQSVVEKQDFNGNGEVVIDISLERDNNIEITVPGLPSGALGVRVTQVAEAELGLLRQGYFGLNTSDIESQREFYELLGFIGEIYPAGPETSTTFAQSLGFPEDYLIHVSLHSLTDPPTQPFVDTVEFRGNSFREEAPYEKLNHLGMAYATYSTTDLDADIALLRSRGVEFISPPATAPNGERFAFMKDQDDIFIKLIHTTEGDAPTTGVDLVRLVNTNMNVSDLERSREFYRLVGFTESADASQSGSGEFAAAHGFNGPIEFEGIDVSLGEGTDGATLQLRQWISPYDSEEAYPPPVNHLGIDRINFYVEDLDATIAAMNDLGYEQLGPVGGGPGFGIVFFFDPDGIKVQFAGPTAN